MPLRGEPIKEAGQQRHSTRGLPIIGEIREIHADSDLRLLHFAQILLFKPVGHRE